MTISRRTFVGVSAATTAALAISPLRLLAQLAPSNFTELRGGVGTFVGQGGTIGWYIAGDAAVVIDSQFPRTAEPCRKGLEERSKRGLDLLINTHHHGDHTSGNGVFKDAVKKIVAHRNVPILQKKQATERGRLEGQVYADTTFETTWKQEFAGDTVHAKYYGSGAHTGGDAMIRFEKANVAHLGDLVFNRWHPFIDLPGGGSIVGWEDVLGKIHGDLDDETICIFGHGSQKHGITGTRKDVQAMRDYFRRALDHVRKGMEAGDEKEKIVSAELKGFEEYESPGARMSLSGTLARTYEDLEARAKGK
jgi:cyclase